MYYSKLFPLAFLALCCLSACNKQIQEATASISPIEEKLERKSVKNIILLIGDGMGLGQITAGMYDNGNKTALEKFDNIGLHKSDASNKLVTDSAAGATAFACGVKTYNGAIGVDSDTISTCTILELAEGHDKKTGLIATSTIVHATPASFIAHNKYRKNYEEIAADFLKTDIDLFIGGGAKYFNNRETDDRNLYEELKLKGYQVSDYFTEDINTMSIDPNKKLAYLTALDDPIPVAQGRDYLLNSVKKSLDYFDHNNEKGFFLMVEGSQIDWGGHANNQEYVLTEFAEFDTVIDYVQSWAEQDGETLVIVTADHETGGMAIQPESTKDSIVMAFTSTYHTATMIPVFAYGPYAELFRGIYPNTAIYFKMNEAFGWSKELK